MDNHVPTHFAITYLPRRDYANCSAIRRSPFAHEMRHIAFHTCSALSETRHQLGTLCNHPKSADVNLHPVVPWTQLCDLPADVLAIASLRRTELVERRTRTLPTQPTPNPPQVDMSTCSGWVYGECYRPQFSPWQGRSRVVTYLPLQDTAAPFAVCRSPFAK